MAEMTASSPTLGILVFKTATREAQRSAWVVAVVVASVDKEFTSADSVGFSKDIVKENFDGVV